MGVAAIERIEKALAEATERIASGYLRLPIVGGRFVYRERLYCYELYHQLRCALGDEFEYSVGGEIDKAGHPKMRGRGVQGTKPDLLIHGPGEMAKNLLVIEVKPSVTTAPDKIKKDLQTLTGYRGPGEYKFAWYLIYDGDADTTRRFREICRTVRSEPHEPPIDLSKIQLFWHPGAGRSALHLHW